MIEKEKIVKVQYDLYVDGEKPGKEELMERAPKEHPLVYCHGMGMMLPQFEANMEGKQAGEAFDFRIAARDAYGEYDDEAVLTLERSVFEIDGRFDEERVFVGNVVPMTTVDGQIVNAQVSGINDTHVTIDLNHPLAGENLHFVGTILEVRDATIEELEQMRNPRCGGCGGCGNGGGCGADDCSKGCCEGCN